MTTVLSRAFHRKAATIGIILVILVTLFVTQVSADSLGPNLPAAGDNVTGIGTVAWTDPGDITAADGTATTVSVPSGGGITNYLRGTQFGFAIPAGSSIQGITVQIYHRTVGNPNPQLRDYVVQLVKGGTIVGDNKADLDTDWPHAGYVLASYGGPGDLWGETWSVDDVNNENFGVVLSAKNDNPSNNKFARVDYMQITIEYAPPDNPELTLRQDCHANYLCLSRPGDRLQLRADQQWECHAGRAVHGDR